ncbi:penicillinase repressor [Lachnospiraceae bacterium]|jgi:predicted transcriptional regulator|nr:BlaI/MecI/CopY family transcriptional regulator [Eubacterium sp.]GFI25996.1 penicillinase repressor [Lachnospiraceae bacterium]
MDYKLCDGEYHLMEIVWELEPVTSTDLYKECLPRLGWKKSTTYTMLRKLCERGLLQNQNSVVTSRVKKADVQRFDSKELIEKRFDHSLPRFVAAFLGERKLSEQEADELTKLIDTCRAGRDDG